MTVVDSPEAPGITPDELDIDLVHWHWMPDRQQALQFTAQGWALVEALAQFGEYLRPQHRVSCHSPICEVVCRLLPGCDSESSMWAVLQWRSE
jgi:hypothetical protein